MGVIKEAFIYYRENVRHIFLKCLTGFILLAVIMHFVFINMPDKTTVLYDNLSGFIEGLEIPEYGWGCFWGIFLNNIKTMFICILYGFIPFVFLPVIVLCVNIMSVSVVSAYTAILGSSPLNVLFLMLVSIVPHGIFEIPAICLAVALGTNLCIKLNKKIIGNEEIIFWDTVKYTFIIAVTLVLPLTVIAGLIESFVTPLILNMFI